MLKINVGLSRKVTQDYNSRGYSLNIEGELPSEVLHDQEALTRSTHRLFQLANLLLDQQVDQAKQSNGQPGNRPEKEHLYPREGNGNPAHNGNGRNFIPKSPTNENNHNNGHGQGERKLTQAQGRAIQNMTRKLNLKADQWARDEFGVNTVNELTVKQASEAIDIFKRSLDAEGVSR